MWQELFSGLMSSGQMQSGGGDMSAGALGGYTGDLSGGGLMSGTGSLEPQNLSAVQPGMGRMGGVEDGIKAAQQQPTQAGGGSMEQYYSTVGATSGLGAYQDMSRPTTVAGSVPGLANLATANYGQQRQQQPIQPNQYIAGLMARGR